MEETVKQIKEIENENSLTTIPIRVTTGRATENVNEIGRKLQSPTLSLVQGISWQDLWAHIPP